MSNDKKLNKQQLHQMDDAERIVLATRIGAEDVDDMNKKELVDFIFSNQNKLDDEIDQANETGESVEPIVFRGRKYPGFSGKKRKIVVSESGKEGDPNYVYVGINGDYEAQIPRGVECTVPEEVVDVILNLAVQTHIKKEGKKTITKSVNRFSLSVNEPVHENEPDED